MSHRYAEGDQRSSLTKSEIGSVKAATPSSLWPRQLTAALAVAKFQAGRVRQAARGRTSRLVERGHAKGGPDVAARVLSEEVVVEQTTCDVLHGGKEANDNLSILRASGMKEVSVSTLEDEVRSQEVLPKSEAKRKADEEEARRKTAEAKRKAEEDEARRKAAEAKRKAEEEESWRTRALLEDAQRKAVEAKRKADEEKSRRRASAQKEVAKEDDAVPFLEQAVAEIDDHDEFAIEKTGARQQQTLLSLTVDEDVLVVDVGVGADDVVLLDSSAQQGAENAVCAESETALLGASTDAIVEVLTDQVATDAATEVTPKASPKSPGRKKVIRRSTAVSASSPSRTGAPKWSGVLEPVPLQRDPSLKGRGSTGRATSRTDGESAPREVMRRRAASLQQRGNSIECFRKLPYKPDGTPALLPGKLGDRHVFWTGGYDSTWRVLQALLIEGLPVVPIYLSGVIDNFDSKKHKRRSNDFELAAIQRIRDEILQLDPDAGQRLRELVIVPNVFLDASLISNMAKLQANKMVRRKRCQYGTCAQLSTDIRTPIDVAIVEGDFQWQSMQPYLKQAGKEWLISPAAIMEKPELIIFRWLRFPLMEYSKESILEEAKGRGLEQIMSKTWSCWFPKDGEQCGKCQMCKHRIV